MRTSNRRAMRRSTSRTARSCLRKDQGPRAWWLASTTCIGRLVLTGRSSLRRPRRTSPPCWVLASSLCTGRSKSDSCTDGWQRKHQSIAGQCCSDENRSKKRDQRWDTEAAGGAFRRATSSERATAALSRRDNGAAAVRLPDKTARAPFPHEASADLAALFRASEAQPVARRKAPPAADRPRQLRRRDPKIIPMI